MYSRSSRGKMQSDTNGIFQQISWILERVEASPNFNPVAFKDLPPLAVTMYSISLGNTTEAEGSLTVKGLPPLVLDVGKGGYLDGYVVSAKSLRNMYLTKNYEDIYTMAMALSYDQHRRLDQFRTGTLAVLQLLNSWARVQILKRIGVAKVSVYFVDTGLVQDVSINNLYVLPSKMRNKPPLAIPIFMNTGAPEVDYDELQKLRGAKVAVKLDGKGPDNTIYGSEFTVFERNSHNNLEIVEALKDPQFQIDRVNEKGALLHMKQATLASALSSTTTAVVSTTAGSGITVLVVALICVLIFVGVVIVALLFLIRKIRHARRVGHQQPPAEVGAGEDQRSSQRWVQQTGDLESEIAPRAPRRTAESHVSKRDHLPAVIPLQADGLAVVTATIALANYENDREREKRGEAVQIAEEKTLSGIEAFSGNILTISTEHKRVSAGLSDISSIHSDISPGPRCSTPLAHMPPVFTPLRPPRQPACEPSFERSEEKILPPTDGLDNISSYSDILDVRQFVSRNILERTIYPADETAYMTAPDSPGSRSS